MATLCIPIPHLNGDLSIAERKASPRVQKRQREEDVVTDLEMSTSELASGKPIHEPLSASVSISANPPVFNSALDGLLIPLSDFLTEFKQDEPREADSVVKTATSVIAAVATASTSDSPYGGVIHARGNFREQSVLWIHAADSNPSLCRCLQIEAELMFRACRSVVSHRKTAGSPEDPASASLDVARLLAVVVRGQPESVPRAGPDSDMCDDLTQSQLVVGLVADRIEGTELSAAVRGPGLHWYTRIDYLKQLSRLFFRLHCPPPQENPEQTMALVSLRRQRSVRQPRRRGPPSIVVNNDNRLVIAGFISWDTNSPISDRTHYLPPEAMPSVGTSMMLDDSVLAAWIKEDLNLEKLDIYAFGLWAVEILIGRPWKLSHKAKMMSSPLFLQVPPLAPLPQKYHERLSGLIRRCLAFRPEERPGFADILHFWQCNVTDHEVADIRKAENHLIANEFKALGNKKFAEGRYVEALEWFDKAIDTDPTCAIYYSNRSATYGEQNRWTESLADSTKTIQLQPTWFKGFVRRGAALHAMLRHSEALQAYEQAKSLEPNDAAVVHAHSDLLRIVTDLKASQESPVSVLPSDEQSNFHRMLTWVQDGGGQFPKLTLAYLGAGHRGVQTITKVLSHEVVIYIPVRRIMSSVMARDSEIGHKITNSGVDLRNKHTYLASYLLQEKAKGSSSEWWPYICTLPPRYDSMPIFFDEPTLSWLTGSFTLAKIADRIDSLKREYDNIRRAIPEFSQFSLEDFIWARMVVITRTYGLDIDGSKTDGLIPFADMLNHRRPRDTKWTYDSGREGFTLTSMRNMTRGDEVCCSYGPKCNSRFLVNYGFALDENDRDNEATIRVQIPKDSPAFQLKFRLLNSREYGLKREFQIPAGYRNSKVKELFAFMRLACATTSEFMDASSKEPFQLSSIEPMSIENEISVLRAIADSCRVALAAFPTSLQEDVGLLKRNELPMFSNLRNCVVMRKGEKEVLHSFLDLEEKAVKFLRMGWQDLKKSAVSFYSGSASSNVSDYYMTSVVVPLVKRHSSPSEELATASVD